MKKLKLIVMIMLLVLALTGCGNKEETENKSSNKNDVKVEIKTDGEVYQKNIPGEKEDIIKNIKVDFKKAKSGKYVAFITNNNTFAIPELEINVNFYKNGKIVDTDHDGHDVILPGYTVVSDFDSYESFDDAKYEIEIEWDNNYRNHSDNVKIDYNINSSNEVLVTVKNNSDVDIREIEIIAVFYDKNGDLLDTSYSKDIYDVSKGKTVTEKLTIHEYSLEQEIKDVKIYINQAHTF